MVGHAGQAPYVMACAYLDALAHYRRARQLPAMSIHWGALAEVGMLTRHADVESYLRRSGVGLLTPGQAMQLLDKALQWNPIEIGIASVDWRVWAQLHPASMRSPKYAGLLDTAGSVRTQGLHPSGHAEGFGGPPEQREPVILQFLVDSLSRALQLAPEKIDLHLPLPSLGMDSLSALDLRSDIETQMSIKVPMLELMKQTTLSQLAHYITGLADSADAVPQPDTKRYRIEEIDIEDAESVLGKVEGFADEDVDRLLAELTRERRVGE
jgi:acyl carrier protein